MIMVFSKSQQDKLERERNALIMLEIKHHILVWVCLKIVSAKLIIIILLYDLHLYMIIQSSQELLRASVALSHCWVKNAAVDY